MDLKSKKVKRLGTVAGNKFACGVCAFNGIIAFDLTTKDDNGFYLYDTVSGTMSETAIVKTSANPQAFISLTAQ